MVHHPKLHFLVYTVRACAPGVLNHSDGNFGTRRRWKSICRPSENCCGSRNCFSTLLDQCGRVKKILKKGSDIRAIILNHPLLSTTINPTDTPSHLCHATFRTLSVYIGPACCSILNFDLPLPHHAWRDLWTAPYLCMIFDTAAIFNIFVHREL